MHPSTTKRGDFMPIIYNRMLELMESKGITSYTIKKKTSSVKPHLRKVKRAEILTLVLSLSSASFLNVSRWIFWNMWKM